MGISYCQQINANELSDMEPDPMAAMHIVIISIFQVLPCFCHCNTSDLHKGYELTADYFSCHYLGML